MQISQSAAVITGGASGLGEATARCFAEAGAKVMIFDVNEERGKLVADEIGGGYTRVDVTDEASVEAGLDAANAAHGDTRVLINCAGVGEGQKTTSRGVPHALAAFERTIKINLIGTFNCIRLTATRMAALEPTANGERGVIVNTASVAAYEGQIGQAAYSASKGGIVGMTLPIARDLARDGIRVCTIAPGIFDTPLMGTLSEEIQQALGASVPFPARLGKAREYAALAQHICENEYLNGETIRIDGAIRLTPR